MGRYLSWLANAALLGLCCFLAANTANTVFAALLTPAPEEVAPSEPPAPARERSWGDRKVILDRNLFDSAVVAPPVAVVETEPDEELEATQLPLDLLGTICSNNPERSVAVVQDRKARENLVLKVNDPIQGNGASVERIECRRIVLREKGKLRELVLAEDEVTPPSPARSVASRKPAAGASRRANRRNRRTPSRAKEDRAGSMRAAAKLFSEAQILPKYEEGEMVGVQVNAIQPGSMFEKLGFSEGDVITRLNDIEINSPEESAQILAEFTESTEFTVELDDGSVRTMTLDPDEIGAE